MSRRAGDYEKKNHQISCQSCGRSFSSFHPYTKWCKTCRESVKREQRAINGQQEFRAIDGEGIGNGSSHRYVLLGVGNNQREWPDGVTSIGEIFEFLYENFVSEPYRIYGGFYLTYDWNMWLRLLPRERAWRLLSEEGIRSRIPKRTPRTIPFPVRHEGWEFDVLWGKRFKLRPEGSKGENTWLYINDLGPFFQTSLLNALYKRSENVEITDEEVELIARGKSRRNVAELDDDMRLYNRLENRALEEMAKELARGFRNLGLKLGKTEFHGPGQAAQKWALKQEGILRSNNSVQELPKSIIEPLIASYYGGIFEIVAHGHVPGSSYEYDINSAYPFAAIQLPCLCGKWTNEEGVLTLYHCIVSGKDKVLGPLPHRTSHRKIRRPDQVRGWYWKHEIDAARRAGLIDDMKILETIGYKPCDHPTPVAELKHLYETRIRLGKESALGKAMKLVYNSLYGKFAQSIGEPKVANVVFASLITSFCRTQILDAIATHPTGTKALLMIATDALFFSEPHPNLPLSDQLGEWEETQKMNLTIFKPGMYWDDKARDKIKLGEAPVFKSRGVNAADFAEWIEDIDNQFRQWSIRVPYMRKATPEDHTFRMRVSEGWPKVKFPMGFNQVSIKAALNMTEKIENKAEQLARYRQQAGRVSDRIDIAQSSDPSPKRNWLHMKEDFDGNIWRSRPWKAGPIVPESLPYDKRFGMPEEPKIFESEHGGLDEPLDIAYFEALNLE